MDVDSCKHHEEEMLGPIPARKRMQTIVVQDPIIDSFRGSTVLVDFFPFIRTVHQRAEEFEICFIVNFHNSAVI